MAQDYLCWHCGASLHDLVQPFGRNSQCPQCHRKVHVCLMCVFYNPRKANACDETITERVKDKDKVNFCDYFKASTQAYQAKDTAAAGEAEQSLNELFGLNDQAAGQDNNDSRSELEDLFGLPGTEKKDQD